MSRRKRHVAEEDFDEYALWDDRMRGFSHARLEDAAPENEDYGIGPGYLGRARQSPRSPSIIGDDEIRPSRRRAASPDDSDRGGERRGLRKVGDAFDRDDVFDEPFIFVEPRNLPPPSMSIPPVLSEASLKNAMRPSAIFRDWCWFQDIQTDADAVGNFAFLRQQRVLDSDGIGRLNNLQIRGMAWIHSSTVQPLPEAAVVELVVVYDRSRTQLSGSTWNSTGAVAPFTWSDVFSPSVTNFTYPSGSGVFDPKVFNFTSPETSSRFRVLHRKMYKLDFLLPNATWARNEGTAVNVDPALDYAINIATSYYRTNGGPVLLNSPRATTLVHFDEFINLCGLPIHFRTGSDAGTAVDTEGAVYVGIRHSAESATALAKIYLNTRLNISVPSDKAITFY